MGQPPQCAARLHFRAAGISRKNAHGPGHCKRWRARTGGTGESSTGGSRNSCSLTGATRGRACARRRRGQRKTKSSSRKRRLARSRRTVSWSNWITSRSEFSHSFTGGGGWCDIAGAQCVTNSETDCASPAGGLSTGVAVSSASK
jgi:hypothetical protein